jgi:hypothetical protein
MPRARTVADLMRYGIGSENRWRTARCVGICVVVTPARVLLQLAGELDVRGPVQRALDVTLAE